MPQPTKQQQLAALRFFYAKVRKATWTRVDVESCLRSAQRRSGEKELSEIKVKRCQMIEQALSELSLEKAMIRWSQSSTLAPQAEVLRQHEGSGGPLQRRNRPLSHVPVGAFSPKAVQWSKEEQVKSVLAPFYLDLGLPCGIWSACYPKKHPESASSNGERKPV